MFGKKVKQCARVLVADDHLAVAEVLRALLEPEFDVIATVGDGNALVAAAAVLTPEVIVTDIAMPGQHALYRQVLAARLGDLQRVQVHRRMRERPAQGYGPQTPTIATQLAFHFVHGRLPPAGCAMFAPGWGAGSAPRGTSRGTTLLRGGATALGRVPQSYN
jgi:CheY-like chemotaxis protein